MNPKTKTALILLTPVGVLLGVMWLGSVFSAVYFLASHSQVAGSEMWLRAIFTLISAGAFAVLVFLFGKKIKEHIEYSEAKKGGSND